MKTSGIHLAVFASGGGSNARALTEYFRNHPDIKISLFLANKKDSGVFSLGQQNNIPAYYLPPADFKNPESLLLLLQKHAVDYIILAGFLLMIPEFLIQAFPDKIINIHPSLLPKYGGKGMYGKHVHEAVRDAGEKSSGCTIHLVNEKYDEGQIIFQAETSLSEDMTPEDIAAAVLRLEHRYYGPTIEKYILGKVAP